MIVNRYLAREVFQTLSAVTLILLTAFLCQQVVRYLNYVAIGKIPNNLLFELVSFEIPYLLALLIPLALYIGIIIAYGRFYADNEMAILELCGFGNKQLLKITSSIALIVTVFVVFLMLWVNPAISAKRQQIMTTDEATLHLIQTLIPGRFQASPDGQHVMYVEKISRDHQRAKNVFLAQQKKDETQVNKWMLVLANEGYQVKDSNSNDQFFVTADGNRYEGSPGENDFRIIQFKKYGVRMLQNQERTIHKENEALSSWELWQDYNNPKRAAELQWRISIGILTFLLALMAMPLSKLQPRQGRFLIILPAIVVYIVYINLLFVARRWVEVGTVSIFTGVWWVHLLMLFGIFIIMLWKYKDLRLWRRAT